jgi:hypothetical protein
VIPSSGVLLPGARAPPITRFAEGILSWAFFSPAHLYCSRCSADLFPCAWFCSLTDLGSRAGAPAFFRFGGLFQLLVQCFGRSGLINWSKFWSASDVGLFRTKNPTFPLFICSAIPQNLFLCAWFCSLTNIWRFLSFFVPYNLFPQHTFVPC